MNTRLSVRHVMEHSPVVVTIDRPVGALVSLMNQRRIGSVLVADDAGRLLGIFTERDLLRQMAEPVVDWQRRPVGEWMTADPITVTPDVGWDEAVTLMTHHRVRRLPVVEDGKVVGLLSARMLMERRTEYLNQLVEDRTLELRRANDQLIARDQEVLYNLRAAGRLQMQLLPHATPNWPEFQWAVHYAPLDHLGGDYYDFATPAPDHLGFLIADASGHSVAAAMVAVLARFAFAEISPHTTNPGEVLTAINQRLQGVTEERFVTAFYGVFDRRTRVLRYSNAGHPYPMLFNAVTATVRPIAAQGFMLGVVPDEVYAEKEVTLAPGDVLCFYTDGLVEARNEIGELFGDDRLIGCLERHAGEKGDLIARVLNAQREFCSGVPLSDDLTVAVCRLPT